MEQSDSKLEARKEYWVEIISVVVAAVVIFVAQYLIGKRNSFRFCCYSILPMLFAVIIGMIISMHPVRHKIKVWGKIFTEKEEGFLFKNGWLQPADFGNTICGHDCA